MGTGAVRSGILDQERMSTTNGTKEHLTTWHTWYGVCGVEK